MFSKRFFFLFSLKKLPEGSHFYVNFCDELYQNYAQQWKKVGGETKEEPLSPLSSVK
jgi:hypothetical protein